MSASIAYIVLLLALCIVLPVYAVLTGKDTKKKFEEAPEKKVIYYRQIIVIQLILATLVFTSMALNGDNIDLIGLAFFKKPIWVLTLISATLIIFWLLNQIKLKPEDFDKLSSKYKDVDFLLPASRREYQWSIAVSYAAGICEEIAFRGFLYWQLLNYMPSVPSVFIVNIVFALSHYSTNLKNMIAAFILGSLLSISFIFTGSLWLAMLVHILVDIYSFTTGWQFSLLKQAHANREMVLKLILVLPSCLRHGFLQI